MTLRTYQTKHGPMLAFEGDQYMTPTLEKRGAYAPDEWSTLAQIARPGMVVVEIGANIGVHSIPLARACAPAPFYCFEPQQRVFQVLCANLALNGISNALAYPDACGEAEGEAVIPRLDYDAPQNLGGVSLRPRDSQGVTVRVRTLDGLKLPALGLLKIDVEGFEPMVLRGARETIARCRPVIYIENDRTEQQGEVIGLLAEMGYRMYWHTPALADPEVFGGQLLVSVNMLCLPAESGGKVQNAEMIDPDNWVSPIKRPGA